MGDMGMQQNFAMEDQVATWHCSDNNGRMFFHGNALNISCSKYVYCTCSCVMICNAGISLGMRLANERRRYIVTTSLIGWRIPRLILAMFTMSLLSWQECGEQNFCPSRPVAFYDNWSVAVLFAWYATHTLHYIVPKGPLMLKHYQ